ncbi:HAMP domain-containing histidine kinase [Paenibacillus sp. J5C_2022]|uniref:sensor histidine kinase n=1 Tax=Paenibacillus sp. J5C2022 TaxID=2977129 RepID=UPI0021D355E6|nr:HAMP domain-containing histidine kinase [Paenibacillus sp. J5C2022]MCU6712913.1 HAMP domain-containing histidine kinase [Paenibacillus sp. J5C2022]
MFARTSSKLTLFFAVLMVLFLLAVNISSYFLLSSIIYKEQQVKLETIVSNEWKEHSVELLAEREKEANGSRHRGKEDEAESDDDIEIPLRPFYMVLDHKGHIVKTNAVNGELAHDISEELKVWVPKENTTLHLVYDIEKSDVHLLLAGKSVYNKDKYVGSIIAGMDVTEQNRMLDQVLLTGIIISIVFLMVSIAISYMMSRRAMKPIMRSFEKQQKFTADASHELRTPLAVLHSSIEVLESEGDENLSPFSRQVLQDMKDEVKRMTRLVVDLLTLARADAAAVRLSFIEFDLDEELERALRNFQPMSQQRSIEIVKTGESGVVVQADQERFRQLMVILLDNAMQYTNQDGKIIIDIAVRGRMLTLRVKDTGIGIPEEKMKEIFERFHRLDESRNRAQGHAGLGLSIAQWIVEAHRGMIRVESKVGEGSTFIIVMPIVSLK